MRTAHLLTIGGVSRTLPLDADPQMQKPLPFGYLPSVPTMADPLPLNADPFLQKCLVTIFVAGLLTEFRSTMKLCYRTA